MDELHHTKDIAGAGIVAQATNSENDNIKITVQGENVEICIWKDDAYFNFCLSRQQLAYIILTPLMQQVLGPYLTDPNWYLT